MPYRADKRKKCEVICLGKICPNDVGECLAKEMTSLA